ncbi:MAG: hypothetical protein ACI9DJ_002941, partial [Algoriphagus sp.]
VKKRRTFLPPKISYYLKVKGSGNLSVKNKT